jgi:asparagine synthase (glutamine-hydrolysing)
MGSPNARVQVVHNGEIYNFQSLLQELQAKGHHFRSRSDAEVLLHGFAEWGFESLVRRLQGMFAFAIFDDSDPLRAPILWLARDPYGVKPLYFAQDAQLFVFASEVRALESTGLFPAKVASLALVRFLQWGSLSGSLTTVPGVQALPPGHIMRVHGGGIKNQRSVAAEQSAPSEREAGDLHAGVRRRVEGAVANQLVSDVPVGVFLSGGVDSSILTAIASRRASSALRTVSLTFDEAAYDESKAANLVSERYKTKHHESKIRQGAFMRELPQIFEAMDQPTIDGVSTYFVAKAARAAGLKVVLSGLGADELFWGGDHFGQLAKVLRWTQMLGRIPAAWRPHVVAIAAKIGAMVGKPGLAKLAVLTPGTEESVYQLFRGLFTTQEVQRLLGATDAEVKTWREDRAGTPISTLPALQERMTDLEFTGYLQGQLLRDTDVMSMRHSLETRLPFLDPELVRFVRGVSAEEKLNGDMPKPMLLKAFMKDLPKDVWSRPRHAFELPMKEWLLAGAGDLEAMACQDSPLDRKAVQAVWSEFKAGSKHWSRAWATVVAAQYMAATRRLDRSAVEHMAGAVV